MLRTRFLRAGDIRIPPCGYFSATTTLLAALTLFFRAFMALARSDRSAPTKPWNFRVTAKTPFGVSLAWSPSSDNSGNFTYTLASSVGAVILPNTATSYTWTSGLYPARSYQFVIFARDA